jgi:hypothetical protein
MGADSTGLTPFSTSVMSTVVSKVETVLSVTAALSFLPAPPTVKMRARATATPTAARSPP